MSLAGLRYDASMNWPLWIERWVREACTSEVYAEKPGNVSPSQQFVDIDLDSFVRSAEVIAPVMGRIVESTVGDVVLTAIRETQQAVQTNTNLGIVLLIAPLAAVPEGTALKAGIETVLRSLTVDDTVKVFDAIRLAAPSGLGKVQAEDVTQAPTMNLQECMRLAADRDLIAAQYANGFRDVLGSGMSWLQHTAEWPADIWPRRLGWLALKLMETYGDSLVERKCGAAASREVSIRASDVLKSGWPHDRKSEVKYAEFDHYLRTDGHQRNPGTTADMIAAILFAGLRESVVESADEGRDFRFTLKS